MKRIGVKVCGITRVVDAELGVELGADFIGLNFWPGSSRCIDLGRARAIARAVAGRARLVGVWVDPAREALSYASESLGLDLLQVHGDTVAAASGWFPDRVICAVQLSSDRDELRLEALDQAWGYLVDAAPVGAYGGTGRAWRYERIASLETQKPILLAGGLRPENVGEAIRTSGADIVDVCSGVEASPGVKSRTLLERFMREVEHATSQD